MPPASTDPWAIPELGPSLGRLVDPPQLRGDRGSLDLILDDIRLDLVTGIFELAGAARSFAASGDRQGAISSLSRVAWLGLWERAVAALPSGEGLNVFGPIARLTIATVSTMPTSTVTPPAHASTRPPSRL